MHWKTVDNRKCRQQRNYNLPTAMPIAIIKLFSSMVETGTLTPAGSFIIFPEILTWPTGIGGKQFRAGLLLSES